MQTSGTERQASREMAEQTGQVEPWVWSAVGGGLIVLGLTRRSLCGLALAISGGVLLASSVKDQRRMMESHEEAPRSRTHRSHHPPAERPEQGPSFQNESEVPLIRQTPEDIVDETSMESFPASDAPSHGVSRT